GDRRRGGSEDIDIGNDEMGKLGGAPADENQGDLGDGGGAGETKGTPEQTEKREQRGAAGGGEQHRRPPAGEPGIHLGRAAGARGEEHGGGDRSEGELGDEGAP